MRLISTVITAIAMSYFAAKAGTAIGKNDKVLSKQIIKAWLSFALGLVCGILYMS